MVAEPIRDTPRSQGILLHRVDKALHAAKAAGRDRVLRADAVGCGE
ncbi:PleD family two-component response regulator [Azospirillum agricola]|nr:hypothetical protein [Azospirillum agricola]MBP2230855.1 PleD family two-component response regulator [Azospirillum agricola]